MILVSTETGSWELRDPIRRQGVPCEKEKLPYGDASFEGFGPHGIVGVGVERKRIRDLLNCIDDGRFSGHQAIGMRQQFKFNFLFVEGEWKPHDQSGLLLELYPTKDHRYVWGPMRPQTPYSKLRRFLYTVSLGGIVVVFTRNLYHTAYDICELYHWFQKPWHKHTALQEMHTASFLADSNSMIPGLKRKPNLVRLWARDLDGIDLKKSANAGNVFKSGLELAMATEEQWREVEGIGPTLSKRIVKQIRGLK